MIAKKTRRRFSVTVFAWALLPSFLFFFPRAGSILAHAGLEREVERLEAGLALEIIPPLVMASLRETTVNIRRIISEEKPAPDLPPLDFTKLEELVGKLPAGGEEDLRARETVALLRAYYLENTFLEVGVNWEDIDRRAAGPPEAVFIFDSRLIRGTGLKIGSVPAGRRRLVVSAPGWSRVETTLEIKKGRRHEAVIDLKARRGTLAVSGTPEGADVYLDGVLHGQSPIIIENLVVSEAAGPYSLAVRRDDYRDFTDESVSVPGASEYRLELLPGSLLLSAAPGEVSFFLGGRSLSMAGGQRLLENLEPGVYRLRVEREGYHDHEEKVEIEPDGQTSVHVELSPRTGRLDIRSEPPGATVFLNGIEAGKTPLALDGVKVSVLAGGYELALELPHYFPVSHSLRVEPGETHEVSVVLNPRPGSIRAMVTPGHALIRFRGSESTPGSGGVLFDAVPAGEVFTMEISAPGYRSETVTLELAPEEKRELATALEPQTGILTVESTPPGARVFLNGAERGVTPYAEELEVSVVAGLYELRLAMDGHETVREKLEIAAEETSKRDYRLLLLPPAGELVREVVGDDLLRHPARVLAPLPDGGFLAGLDDGLVIHLPPGGGRIEEYVSAAQSAGGAPVALITIYRDALENLWVLTSAGRFVRRWNFPRGPASLQQWQVSLPVNNPARVLAHLPGKGPEQRGRLLVGVNNGVFYWATEYDGKLEMALEGRHRGIPAALAVSPCARWALSGGAEGVGGRLMRWSLGEDRGEQWGRVHYGHVQAVDISRDGRLVLSADSTGEVVVQRADGTLAWSARGRPAVNAAVFSPDSRFVVSGGADGVVVVRAAEEGTVLERFQAHEHALFALAFTPDGRYLLTSGQERRSHGKRPPRLALWEGRESGGVARPAGGPDSR